MSIVRNALLVFLATSFSGSATYAEAAGGASPSSDSRDALTSVSPAETSIAMPNWVREVIKGWSPDADGLIHTPQAATDLAWVMLVSQNKTHSTLSQWRKLYEADLKGDVWIVHVRETRPYELGHGLMCFISRKDGRFLGAYMDQ